MVPTHGPCDTKGVTSALPALRDGVRSPLPISQQPRNSFVVRDTSPLQKAINYGGEWRNKERQGEREKGKIIRQPNLGHYSARKHLKEFAAPPAPDRSKHYISTAQ
ncbi:hypothetical protein EVAR_24714_1 [Eumeta japonica]|uniref:Uncharacterized protein n=1 Tax=Eumeta variegata TaxID=151549 RepID=A0A4C1VCY4_EUMVA|nr:hypothetical protein EVAR_24714_1 [Eumeta japonica]